MNDLAELMRQTAGDRTSDDVDVTAVVATGRRRVRTRRQVVAGGVALAAGVTVVASVWVSGAGPGPGGPDAVDSPATVGPVLRLEDARPAVVGVDYRVLDIRPATEQVAGVTADGLLVTTEQAAGAGDAVRVTLLDPATDEKDRLPGGPVSIEWLIEGSSERLVFLARGEADGLSVLVFDRGTRTWSSTTWPGLPSEDVGFRNVRPGPDDRLYVDLGPAGDGVPPAELWSVGLHDPDDVRDEGVTATWFDVSGSLLTWVDGAEVHVRDLTSGEDTRLGARVEDGCVAMGLNRTADRIVLTEDCGSGARHDRFRVLDSSGDPVVTLESDGLLGGVVNDRGVLLSSAEVDPDEPGAGTYAYQFGTGDLVAVSGATRSVGGPAAGAYFRWAGATTQWVGELLR